MQLISEYLRLRRIWELALAPLLRGEKAGRAPFSAKPQIFFFGSPTLEESLAGFKIPSKINQSLVTSTPTEFKVLNLRQGLAAPFSC